MLTRRCFGPPRGVLGRDPVTWPAGRSRGRDPLAGTAFPGGGRWRPGRSRTIPPNANANAGLCGGVILIDELVAGPCRFLPGPLWCPVGDGLVEAGEGVPLPGGERRPPAPSARRATGPRLPGSPPVPSAWSRPPGPRLPGSPSTPPVPSARPVRLVPACRGPCLLCRFGGPPRPAGPCPASPRRPGRRPGRLAPPGLAPPGSASLRRAPPRSAGPGRPVGCVVCEGLFCVPGRMAPRRCVREIFRCVVRSGNDGWCPSAHGPGGLAGAGVVFRAEPGPGCRCRAESVFAGDCLCGGEPGWLVRM
ncbi:hypothetical protein FHS38_007054 [Streptomyces netropsis]|uniref:Uncharacterized protein n=1 Tax=Streptomyces netropsis TaxID=55404 RepID=A0A7W7PHD6_STRNE|nr:hypothetical protein [Streptomyces netropsis]